MPDTERKTAATLGTAVHLALEEYVTAVMLVDDPAPFEDMEFFDACWRSAYADTYESGDFSTDEFEDGWKLLSRWHDRTDLSSTKVISCEQKTSFDLPTSVGVIPFNYIWDRCDYLGDGVYEVVDYKSSRWNVNFDDLETKVQARAYSAACRIQYPEAKKIWVTFDMLRYEPKGISFTREDDVKFWRALKATAERIIAIPEKDAPEKLNDECKWCPIKARCKALHKNHFAGGIHSLTVEEAARIKMNSDFQIAGLKALSEELEKMIMTEAEKQDDLDLVLDGLAVTFSLPKRRSANNAAIANILGPELANRLGRFTLGDIDELLKGDSLSEEQKRLIRDNITITRGNPRMKIKPPAPLTEST
jgi:PD-(D/E)XK nuclease superfamily protein